MGLGDNLLATGLARGAHARGKRIAFGDGRKIIWDNHSPEVFRHNPNIAPRGSEGAPDLEWIAFHRGARQYNWHDVSNNRWGWNMSFRPTPGEMFFTAEELSWAEQFGQGFIIIEPNVPPEKTVAPNKQWPVDRYNEVAADLIERGHDVRQFSYGRHRIPGASEIKAPTFRDALAVLARAALYIGTEGGLHHGAAAVGIPAVVLFGGFIPPQVTGYPTHTNLTGGAEACGSLHACAHCRAAMEAIGSGSVLEAASGYLEKKAA